ncbi:MAG TPA: transposase [Cyclobacteriaceae bacterium]
MNLTEGEIYHVFNRGNNKQQIFPRPENFYYFVSKMENYLIPNCDLLAWCLMPNHFHFLIHANLNSVEIIKDGGFERQAFSQAIKQLLSSYTKAINKQERRTGSLFQQKTKAICVSGSYTETAFHYIHQNPLKARLVSKMEDWEHSSFKDYLNLNNSSLCNRELATQNLNINFNRLYEESYQVINFAFDPN